MNKKYSLVLLISIVVIVAVYSFAGGGGKMDLDIGEHELSVAYEDFSATVNYEDVTAIELVEVSDFGAPVDGGSDKSCRWGTWKNDTWGEYAQYSLTSTSKGVLLYLRDGYFLLSYESGESTELLSEMLRDMLTANGYEAEYIR